ncbi:NAD-dependent succinate-semialdehyde dehydrogenase [Rhizobium leguminosarum]|uniref:NAD-dependent succinate-semialdehyde dehydrogenase n=1 Tax=Rhizobium leguminosarum TaxID=384 RepID=UPI001C96A6E4|nr:NAD-dependent succinate-semialdehyde dehydrogenase [Rhizobium leguminosarum]MBY5406824.1 NAD-dependent succinate-semialdehyde dehydrogenase [Rhizobium leguminosarum]
MHIPQSNCLREHVNNTDLVRDRWMLGGRWVEAHGGEVIAVENPATGAVIGYTPRCGSMEAEAAIEAALVALPLWRSETAERRAVILGRWQGLIRDSADDLARIITLEQGKPLAEAHEEVLSAASYFDWFAEEARRPKLKHTASPGLTFVRQRAIGVIAAITPWNFPSAMIARKAAPALAAGCTMVLKASEYTPFSAFALGALAERAGLPPGVLNILTGDADDIGQVFTGNPAVAKLSFTGSIRTGQLLLQQCAASLKPSVMELGGNAPFIVFADAHFDAAVDALIARKFRNGGQTCVSANRVFVHSSIYDLFAFQVIAKANSLSVGNGLDPEVKIGPTISRSAADRLQELVADAVDHGAKILAGGSRRAACFFDPTVLGNVKPSMRIATEEVFGPIALLLPFETESEVVSLANDTCSGLAGYAFTSSLQRAFRLSDDLDFGMIGINAHSLSSPAAPFGGMKASGLGREGGRCGLEEFLSTKTIAIE